MKKIATSSLFKREIFVILLFPFSFIFLQILFFRLFQCYDVYGKIVFFKYFLSITKELGALFLFFVISNILLSLSGKTINKVFYVLTYTIIVYWIGVNLVNVVYFHVTGANLSWGLISFWINNFKDANRVAGSEVGIGRKLLLFAHIIITVGVIVIPHLKRVKHGLFKTLKPAQIFYFQIILLMISVIFLFLPSLKDRGDSLSKCVSCEIVSQFFEEEILPEKNLELKKELYLDSSIETTGTPKNFNVVLIIFESLGFNRTNLYLKNGPDSTPFLKKLSKNGVLIKHYYTTIPHTTKAIFSIICGMYPDITPKPVEAIDGIIPHRCLPHILRKYGYRTAFFQPALNFEKRDHLVMNMGYEVYKGLNDLPQEGFERTNYFGKEEKIMIKPSIEWIKSLNGKPFFLTYLTLCSHHNYLVPQSFEKIDFGVNDVNLNNYLNAVRYTDEFIKELFSEFKKLGIMKNTLFVIVGDHGEAFGEHGRYQHDQVLWEEGIRAFGLLYAPSILPHGLKKIEGIRSHLDILPTVLDVLNIKVSKGKVLGTSLLKEVPENRVLYFSCLYSGMCLAKREGFTKFIYHYHLKPMEVFNEKDDIFDRKNLALTDGFDAKLLEKKKEDMLRFKKTVQKQFENWKKSITRGVVSITMPEVSRRVFANFDDKIELVGFDVSKTVVRPGDVIKLRYVFKCLKNPGKDIGLFVHLKRNTFKNAGHKVAKGTYPVSKWKSGEYIIDEHYVKIPSNWKPGKARVTIGFWNRKTGKRLKIKKASVEFKNNGLNILYLTVLPKLKQEKGLTIEDRRKKIEKWIGFKMPEISNKLNITFEDTIAIVGVEIPDKPVVRYTSSELVYVFHVLKKVPEKCKLVVKFIDKKGRVLDLGDHVPIGGIYPVKYWRVGEYITDIHKIYVGISNFKKGTFGVYIGFKAGNRYLKPKGAKETFENLAKVGSITVIDKK